MAEDEEGVTNIYPGEEVPEGQSIRTSERIRRVVGDTYSFVRSQEINRSLGSFTLDHYIEEEKRSIKGEGRDIRDAAGEAFDVRPTKLESIDSLEDEFRAVLKEAQALAKMADDRTGEEEESEEQ